MMPVPHTCGFKTKLANLRSHLFVKWTRSFWRFTVYSSKHKSVRTVIYTLVIIKQQKLECLVNASGNCCLIWSVYFKAIITFVHIGLLLITLAVIISIHETRLMWGECKLFLSTNLADLQLLIDFLSSVHSLIWTSGHVLKEYTACEVFFKEVKILCMAHHSNALRCHWNDLWHVTSLEDTVLSVSADPRMMWMGVNHTVCLFYIPDLNVLNFWIYSTNL